MHKHMHRPHVKQTILAVDDTPENLHILKGLLTPEYLVKVAVNGQTALKIASAQPPDLILLDIMMPGMDGYAVCRTLKSNPNTAKIPVIFVTALSDVTDERKGFEVGAVDYITKPIQPTLVITRVRNHLALANQQRACEALVGQRTMELQESQKAAIYMLGDAGHYNDTDTGAHIWRMAAYARALAQAAEWPTEQATMLELSSPMHDTGKLGISDAVLKAPRKLTVEEFEYMKTHTTIGAHILQKSHTPLFVMAASIALNHHERWDGTGYPHGLAGEQIPQEARITAIADVFDALTMKRPYKEPWPLEKAFAVLQKDAGSHFDPKLVTLFLQIKDEIVRIKEQWDEKDQASDDMLDGNLGG